MQLSSDHPHNAAAEKKGESEALHQASKHYEESKEQYFNAMVSLQDSEPEQVTQLQSYVDAQLEFHQKCVEVFKEASATLSRKAQEASSRPKHTHSSHSSVSSSSYGEDHSSYSTPAPAYGAPGGYGADSYAAAPPPIASRAAPPPPPARAAAPGLKRCTALYDFSGEGSGELSFHAGDVITITNMVNAEWYLTFPLNAAFRS